MKKLMMFLAIAGFMLASTPAVFAQEDTLFDFETGLQGWEIPGWAFEEHDYVQESIAQCGNYASAGDKSLRVDANFPGGQWRGALVEIMEYFDWSDYNKVAVDLYVPADAPKGINGAIVLTVGDGWTWVEMSRAHSLTPGEWTTVEADISPGSIDWRRMQVDESFRQDVRKISIRFHYDTMPPYEGPLYVDNVRVIR